MTPMIVYYNYMHNLWNKQMVAVAVEKNVITPQQYKELTGEDYVPASTS